MLYNIKYKKLKAKQEKNPLSNRHNLNFFEIKRIWCCGKLLNNDVLNR